MKKKKASHRTLTNMGITCIVVSMVVTFAPPAGAGRFHHGHEQACSKTSQAAFRACSHDIRDDFWIALGNCANLADHGARKDCRLQTAEVASESREACADQYEARQEVCDALGQSPYDPQIDPEDFVDPLEIGSSVEPNPYFPLIPGVTRIYEGGDEIIAVTNTFDTQEIMGVICLVVRDVVEEEGQVIEDTFDWYAQDKAGNVWYFGEIAQNFEDGELVDIEGSWKAGVDGAKAGIIMKADPAEGQVYRQEFFLGDAEDMGEVISLTESAIVPGAACDGDCLLTRDWTPLEPDVEEYKYYKSGIGVILEVDPETLERLELVEILGP
ncbi:MAG: hypothetical protein R3231_01415 [bacterium]|nr:hypothetical protein [bacterium]